MFYPQAEAEHTMFYPQAEAEHTMFYPQAQAEHTVFSQAEHTVFSQAEHTMFYPQTEHNTIFYPRKKIIVREVWASNLDAEFALIQSILSHYPFVSMDTEFPGFIFDSKELDKRSYSKLTPSQNYELMKANVDALNIIQLGLTLSDHTGHLPDFGSPYCFIWQFNFRDFDIDKALYNEDAIQMLKRQGIDFLKNKEDGIDSYDFASIVLSSDLVFNHSYVTWITFHGAYDFGYLIKILIRQELPHDIDEFTRLMLFFFGVRVYDMKHMMRFCNNGLHGGLEKLAYMLSVNRVAGKSHQAGSDSLLTLQTFFKLKDMYFTSRRGREHVKSMDDFNCVLYGLEVDFNRALYGLEEVQG